MTKANPATPPLGISRNDIFCHKSDRRGLANELVLIRIGLGRNQGENSRAVGRRDAYPPLSGLKAHIEGEVETELINVEPQTPFLIANENTHPINAEVGGVAFQRDRNLIPEVDGWGTRHGGYYKATKCS